AVVSDTSSWVLVEQPSYLQTVLTALEESVLVGLDCETTGLDPRRDRLRLLSLATDRGTYVIDCFAVEPRPAFAALAATVVFGHNLSFDLGFLARRGFVPGKVCDTRILSQLLDGTRRHRGYHGLAACVQRHLGRELPKDLQRSDWSGTLSQEQLEYAAR